MARQYSEYRCLLISPSDVAEERTGISEMMERWNARVGDVLGARVHLVKWETHGVPDLSAPAQEVLNREVVDPCDFGIAVFRTRLGSPTTTHESGSIEEIERLRHGGARVLVYMSSESIPQERLQDEQYFRLNEFKKKLQKEGLLGTYLDVADLREQALVHTTAVVSDFLQRDRGHQHQRAGSPGVVTAPEPDVRVVVFDAQTSPPTPGVRRLLGIRVENHSPVPVYMSGISILLRSGTGLLLIRDVVTGAVQSRTILRPGESLHWSADGDRLLRDFAPDDLADLVAYDDIGRDYHVREGALEEIVRKWAEEGEAVAVGK